MQENENSKDTNRSIQLNPNNDLFWKNRGQKKRPEYWKDATKKKKG